eukprot:SAG25_NODE_254_length_10958_cov_53.133622_8_plen_916_part_00
MICPSTCVLLTSTPIRGANKPGLLYCQVIEYSAFRNNRAQGGGGAIYAADADNVTISHSVFDGCMSIEGSGGSVAFKNVRHVSILQSNVSNGVASKLDGGGINIGGNCDTVLLEEINFYNNSAAGGGGAIWMANDAGERTITGCRGDNNSGNEDGCTLKWVTAVSGVDLHHGYGGCLHGWDVNVDDRWRYVSVSSRHTSCKIAHLPSGASIGNCPANRTLAHGATCNLACTTENENPVPVGRNNEDNTKSGHTASCSNGVLTWNSTCSYYVGDSSKNPCKDATNTTKRCHQGGVCGVFPNIDPFGEMTNNVLCSCPVGWRGDRCTLLDMCANPVVGSSLCKHGNCLRKDDDVNGFACQCAGTGYIPNGTVTVKPFQGLDCDSPICLHGAYQPANGRPCQVKGSSGICKEYGPVKNVNGGAVCNCTPGWWSDTGGRCEFPDPCTQHISVNGRALNGEGEQLCFNGGSCQPDHSNDTETYNFNCRCTSQHHGLRCEKFDWDIFLQWLCIGMTTIATVVTLPLVCRAQRGLQRENLKKLAKKMPREESSTGSFDLVLTFCAVGDFFFDSQLCFTLAHCNQTALFSCSVISIVLSGVVSLYLVLYTFQEVCDCMGRDPLSSDRNTALLTREESDLSDDELQSLKQIEKPSHFVIRAEQLKLRRKHFLTAVEKVWPDSTTSIRMQNYRDAVVESIKTEQSGAELSRSQSISATWLGQNKKKTILIIVLSIFRVETLGLFRLKIRGTWLVDAPVLPVHFHYIRYKLGWFRYFLDDFVHMLIASALLMLSLYNTDCETTHWLPMSSQSIALGSLFFSGLSLLIGVVRKCVLGKQKIPTVVASALDDDGPINALRQYKWQLSFLDRGKNQESQMDNRGWMRVSRLAQAGYTRTGQINSAESQEPEPETCERTRDNPNGFGGQE